MSTLEQTSAVATEGEATPFISVVIPCLNEEENIERCVRDALDGLEHSHLSGEVLVVDNDSEDRSARCSPPR